MSKEQHSNIRDTRHTDTRALEPCDLTAPNIEVHPVNQPNELYSTCDQAVFFFLQTPAMKDNSCRLHRSWSPTVNSVDTFSKLCLPFSRVRSLPPSLHLSLFQARGCLQDCLHRDIFSCLEMTNTLHAGRSYLLCFWFFFSLPFFFFACTSCWIAQVGTGQAPSLLAVCWRSLSFLAGIPEINIGNITVWTNSMK